VSDIRQLVWYIPSPSPKLAGVSENVLAIEASTPWQTRRQVPKNNKNKGRRYLQQRCLLHEENQEPRLPWRVPEGEPLAVKVPWGSPVLQRTA